jgi:hypothetical protein
VSEPETGNNDNQVDFREKLKGGSSPQEIHPGPGESSLRRMSPLAFSRKQVNAGGNHLQKKDAAA